MERLNVVKMSILHKLNHRFNKIPMCKKHNGIIFLIVEVILNVGRIKFENNKKSLSTLEIRSIRNQNK